MVSEATRHVMQANKSKNTKPELRVRAALREAGLTGYRLHWKAAPGKPDICFPGRKLAIFVHGCYWHHCPHCAMPIPRSNVEFWEAKFARNQARDERDCAELVRMGWTVLVVWECRLKKGRFEATMRDVVREVERAGIARERERLWRRELRAHGEGDAERLRPDFVWNTRPRVVEVGFMPAWRRGKLVQRLRLRHSRG